MPRRKGARVIRTEDKCITEVKEPAASNVTQSVTSPPSPDEASNVIDNKSTDNKKQKRSTSPIPSNGRNETKDKVFIPTEEIFSKFQSHRTDFDPNWVLMQEDVTIDKAHSIDSNVLHKLEEHRMQLDEVRQAKTTTAATATAEGAFNKIEELRDENKVQHKRKRARDNHDELQEIQKSRKDAEEDEEEEEEEEEEYNPSTPTHSSAKRAKIETRSKKKANENDLNSFSSSESDNSEEDEQQTIVNEGLVGDYLTFLNKSITTLDASGRPVSNNSLQATVQISISPSNPLKQEKVSQMKRLQDRFTTSTTIITTNNSNNTNSASTLDTNKDNKKQANYEEKQQEINKVNSPTSPITHETRVVPLWSVHRMEQYGGYCASSQLVALHQEVIDLFDFLSPTKAEIAVRRYMELSIMNLINSIWPEVEGIVFGSLYTHLLLPLSDIDMTLRHVPLSAEDALPLIAQRIHEMQLCEDVYPQVILKTKVPLIKFQYKGSHIEVDISIGAVDGKDNSDEVIRLLNAFPEARVLTMIIKYFLQQRDMHEPYRGGLGSYATTLLVISFLQHHPIYTTQPEQRRVCGLGKLLVDFFRYYGYCWNYHKIGIDVAGGVNGSGYFTRQDSSFPNSPRSVNNNNDTLNEESRNNEINSPHSPLGPSQAIIIDPGKPTNNAASSLRNLHTITSAFAHAYLALTATFDHQNNNNNNESESNSNAHWESSPDSTKIAHRPTLLSRILHVDPDTVERRAHINAFYCHLNETEPQLMKQVELYRHDEDEAMLMKQPYVPRRVPECNEASLKEKRELATLIASNVYKENSNKTEQQEQEESVYSQNSSSSDESDREADNVSCCSEDRKRGGSNSSSRSRSSSICKVPTSTTTKRKKEEESARLSK